MSQRSSKREPMFRSREFFRGLWRFFREASGENDYARHQARARERKALPLTREAFYLSQLQHKYSRPNRCC